ncbi:MAG: ankyrin repeat domain-containing protein [Geminicoccaceae bacterium]
MTSADELYEAMRTNDRGSIRRLLQAEAALVEALGKTPPPIHWAIWKGKTQIVDLLLDQGADIERRDPDRNATPLHYAIIYGRQEIVRLLVARGADLKNDDKADNMLDLAKRGAAGEFEEFSDIATTRSAFEEIAELLGELGGKSYGSSIS